MSSRLIGRAVPVCFTLFFVLSAARAHGASAVPISQQTVVPAPKPDVVVTSTPDHVVDGGFPIGSPPVATVKSGQVVKVDALSQQGLTNKAITPTDYFGLFGIKPNEVLPDATDFWNSLPNRPLYGGGHILTGPIYVDGAQPGDTLEVDILAVTPRVNYGFNNTSAAGSEFSPDYPGSRPGDQTLDIPSVPPGTPGNVIPQVTTHMYRTGSYGGQQVAFINNGLRVPIHPFFGTMGVAPPANTFVGNTPDAPAPALGVQSSTTPGNFAGNLDNHDLRAGSKLFIPVHQPDAQFFAGDTHALQGDGEVSGTAIEQSMTGTFRFVLHHSSISQPASEDAHYFYEYGIDWDLDRAMKLAVKNTVSFLMNTRHFTAADAYSFASIAVDYKVSESVDRTQVITAKISKAILSGHPPNPSTN